MSPYIEFILNSPNKIDLHCYAAGAGGEFFTTLCALAHYETREIMTNKTLTAKRHRTDGEEPDSVFFRAPKYFGTKFDIGLSDLGRVIFNYGHKMSPEERVDYINMGLVNALLSHAIVSPSENPQMLKHQLRFGRHKDSLFFSNKNIVLCTHWIYPSEMSREDKKKFFFDSPNRRFGLPLLENQKHLTLININPQTPAAKRMVYNFVNKSNLTVSKTLVSFQLEHPAFTNIKEKFPFMDYMVENNFDAIKYHIENRYGPDIDYDFIDQALIDYRKLRVEPYLCSPDIDDDFIDQALTDYRKLSSHPDAFDKPYKDIS